jgi:predicted glycoside hydrolase/deacetylase ChbG (UPF0249 family)
MKSNFVFSSSSLFIGLFLFFFTENVCSQESADNWTLKQARQWTQKQEWANGLKAMPHKTTDYQEFASQYHKNKKVWDKTFQWLATHDLVNMPAGRMIASVSKCIFETWLTKAQLNKESGIRIKSVTPIVTSHTANAGFILV